MEKADTGYVRSFRGGRVMAPEVRVATNRSGFCPAHYERLYRGEGKLGLGLMVHTHLAASVPELLKELAAAAAAAGRGRGGLDAVERLASSLRGRVEACFICEMLDRDLDRYCFTVLSLWQRDPDFPARLRGSRGFCLPHYAALLDKARKMLRAEELARWLAETVPLQSASLERLEAEVLGFTQRYHHAAAGSSRPEEERTALSRALQKLSGRMLRLERGTEPGPAEDQDQDRLV